MELRVPAPGTRRGAARARSRRARSRRRSRSVPASASPPSSADLGDELLLEREQPLRAAVEPQPGLGRLDAPARAVEELRPEPLLERPHLEADRRLRHAEPLGGLREAAPLDDRAERRELARVHKPRLIARRRELVEPRACFRTGRRRRGAPRPRLPRPRCGRTPPRPIARSSASSRRRRARDAPSGWRERLLDADVELLRAGSEPHAAARAKRLGLRELLHAEHIAVERARRLLAAARRRDLDVVDSAAPASGRTILRRCSRALHT